MKYVTTCTIVVDGDRHTAGEVLRSEAAGTIKAMLRMRQIVPYVEPEKVDPPKVDLKPEPPKEEKPKKADK